MTRQHGLIAHHEDNWVEQSPVEPRAEHSGYFTNTEHLNPDETRVTLVAISMPIASFSLLPSKMLTLVNIIWGSGSLVAAFADVAAISTLLAAITATADPIILEK